LTSRSSFENISLYWPTFCLKFSRSFFIPKLPYRTTFDNLKKTRIS
jgi:hypothetical protein